LEQTQHEKVMAVNKAKATVSDKKATSKFRNRLFGRKEEILSLGLQGGLSTKIPSVPGQIDPNDLKSASPFDKANLIALRERQGLGAPQSQSSEAQQRIQKLFNLVEEKTEAIKQRAPSENQSIVAESIQRSIYGVFSQNYKRFVAEPGRGDSVEIWKHFFLSSEILSDVERSLLYFNLPYDDIIKERLEPHRLYWKELKNAPPKGNDYITDMLNCFEKEKDEHKRLANIILLKVPHSAEFGMAGGYSA
jgi:hypothetical protein